LFGDRGGGQPVALGEDGLSRLGPQNRPSRFAPLSAAACVPRLRGGRGGRSRNGGRGGRSRTVGDQHRARVLQLGDLTVELPQAAVDGLDQIFDEWHGGPS
jgi:hypothetical protein